MKKGSRQSHPTKSVAMKQDTSQGEIDGDSNNPQGPGVFCEDFSLFCEREGLIKIPLIVNSPKLQCSASLDDNSSLGSQVHVTLEDDDPNSLKHVHFRNIKMTAKLASIFLEASRESTIIQGLSLWNNGAPFSEAGGSGPLLEWLAAHQTQHLTIGANTLPVSVFDDIIGPKPTLVLQKLSLKCCQLNDSHCEQLCPCLEENKILLSLHLGCNSITDAGVFYISKALKRNRTLLTLSLMGNKITDEGAIGLAQVLSRFSLTHSEIVDRRKLLMEKKGVDEEHQMSLRSSPSNASLSDRSSRQTKGSTSDKGKPTKTKHDNVTKKEEKLKKEDKSKKVISSPDPPKKAQKGGRDSKMVTAKKATQLEGHSQSPKTESTEPASVISDPLLEEGEEVAGTIVLPGNMILASLSLSNNLITERGLDAFLVALETQKQYTNRGQGLIRFEFKNNLFSNTSSVAIQLEEAMLIRDPFYEPPPPEPQDDTVTMETTDKNSPKHLM